MSKPRRRSRPPKLKLPPKVRRLLGNPTTSRFAARARRPAHPFAVGAIDFGPAIAAVRDLAAWAFDLAAHDVAEWPEGRRRVANARRFVLGQLDGVDVARVPFEDVLFTAGLLARIFEADLELPMAHIVAALDKLGLPTEVVPLMPRRQAAAGADYLRTPPAPITPLRPRPTAATVAPEPDGYCDVCGCVHRLIRNAA